MKQWIDLTEIKQHLAQINTVTYQPQQQEQRLEDLRYILYKITHLGERDEFIIDPSLKSDALTNPCLLKRMSQWLNVNKLANALENVEDVKSKRVIKDWKYLVTGKTNKYRMNKLKRKCNYCNKQGAKFYRVITSIIVQRNKLKIK